MTRGTRPPHLSHARGGPRDVAPSPHRSHGRDGSLDSGERHALADLRDDLRRADPELAASLAGLGVPSPVLWWLGTCGAVLVAVLAVWFGGLRVLGVLAFVLVFGAPLLVGLAGPAPDGPAEQPPPR